jgi:hypothetical protein
MNASVSWNESVLEECRRENLKSYKSVLDELHRHFSFTNIFVLSYI